MRIGCLGRLHYMGLLWGVKFEVKRDDHRNCGGLKDIIEKEK